MFPAILSLALVFWLHRQYRAKAETNYIPAEIDFLERTGLRLLGRENDGLEAQAREIVLGQHDAIARGRSYVQRPLVCDLAGDHLTYFPSLGIGGPLDQAGWVLKLRRPTRIRWSLRKKTNFFFQMLRFSESAPATWTPAHPRVALRDQSLAGLEAFADPGVDLERLLGSPALREALLACKGLDLHVLADRVILLDPYLQNARPDGGVLLSFVLGHRHRMEAAAARHEQIKEMLAQIAAVSRADG